MSKRKVLIVVHQLNIGGVQKALLSALDAIDYSKSDVTLYIRKNRTELLQYVNKGVSRIIVNNDKTKYYRKPYSAWLLFLSKLMKTPSSEQKLNDYVVKTRMKHERKQFFFDTRYDIAVSYIQSHTAEFVAENVNAGHKIMFYHGSTDENHEINEKAMASFDRIVCVSKGSLEVISENYPKHADKMIVLENYIDSQRIITLASEYSPDYSKDYLILCTCGRMTPVKGFDIAVKAAEVLRAYGMKFKWYFVGDGQERTNIEKMIEVRNLQDNIVITGLLENPYPYIKKCDIYIQPSYEEAHPLSLIEAQILCRPIVTTATVGGNTIVKNGVTGSISEINYLSLSQKIIELAGDSSLQGKYYENLSKIDRDADYSRFRKQWSMLLGLES